METHLRTIFILKHPVRRLLADVAAEDVDELIVEMTRVRFLKVIEILETGAEVLAAINVSDIQTAAPYDEALS